MSDRKTRLIRIDGCDDATKLSVELTDSEFEFTERLFAAIATEGGGCCPVPHIETGTYVVEDGYDEYPRVDVPATAATAAETSK
jgi:hypothetical protein